jgi:hypothetical protein
VYDRQRPRERNLRKNKGWRHVAGQNAAALRTFVRDITAGTVIRRRIRDDVHRHGRLHGVRHSGRGQPKDDTQAYQYGEAQTKYAHE